MNCFHPLSIPYEDGKGAGRIFKSRWVPCGRCPACRVNRAEDWANRMLWEASEHDSQCFITLTYCDEKYPADESVDKRTLQLFFKRLRKESKKKLKYFGCGEYGETYGRAHYHACIFGLGPGPLTENLIQSVWPYGNVDVRPFLKARARYVAGYVLKEVDPSISLLGRTRPFALMSKRMGLEFCKRNADRVLEGTLTVGGKPVAVPRYFRKVLDADEKFPLSESESWIAHLPRVSSVPERMRYYAVLESRHKSLMTAESEFKTQSVGRRKRGPF